MSVGVLNHWPSCKRALLHLYLNLLVIATTCCKGSLSLDQLHSNADIWDPCLLLPFPDKVYFDETSSAGSIIFVSNETSSTYQDWCIDTSTRVELTFVKQTYQIALLSGMDLDVADPRDNCISPLQQFVQILTCVRAGGLEPVSKQITFHIHPVNEYPPDVDAVPDIQISEGYVTPSYHLAGLLNYFKDRDCPKKHLVLSISKYSSSERDVSEFFMVNSSTGYLYQIKRFDYEDTAIQCNLGKGGGYLNITAEDGPHKTSKSLIVTFVDVDDTPPVFVNSQCTSTCFTCPISSINANIHYGYQGTVATDPPSIKALDPDTVPTNFTYSMGVYPEKYRDNIQFDNGTFVLLQSFANFSGYAEESDFTVTVTLQATGSNGQMSDNLTLSINIKVPPTTTTTTTTKTTTTTTNTVNSECSLTCFTCPVSSLSAKVLDSYQGPIPFDPPSIKALNPSTTPSSTITYKIEVYPSKYNGIIKIENGTFGLIQSFANFSESREKSDFIVTVIVQAAGNNEKTLKKCVLTIYVVFRPISSTTQQITERASSSPMKDIVIIVLAVVVALLSVILVYAVYRVRVQKKKSEDNVMSYEEVKRNNGEIENVYATIQN